MSPGGEGASGPGGHPLRLVPGPGLGQLRRRGAHRGSLPGSGPPAPPETEAGPGHLSLDPGCGGSEAGLGPHGPISVGCGLLFHTGHQWRPGDQPENLCGLSSGLAVISVPVLPRVCAVSMQLCVVWAGGG